MDSGLVDAVRGLIASEYWWDVDDDVLAQLESGLKHSVDKLASAAVVALAGADDEAVERLRDWSVAMDGRDRLLGALIERDCVLAHQLAGDWWPGDQPPAIPATTLVHLVRYLLERDAWGTVVDLIGWQREAGPSVWPLLAELFDSEGESFATEWAEAVRNYDWAREDPWPADGSRPDGTLFSGIPADDPNRVRAEIEADGVHETALAWLDASRSPVRWLEGLGRALAGCGFAGCCRYSLFEAALLARGYQLRRHPPLTPFSPT